MEMFRVLIVEDDVLISMQLESIVEETVPSVVVVKSSVRDTKKVIDEPFDLALLDIDVTNGKTYEIAKLLNNRAIPFVFVSGSVRSHLPKELQTAPFIAKPFQVSQIKDAVLTVVTSRGSGHIGA